MSEKVVVTNFINEKNVLDKHDIFLYKCLERKIIGKKIEIRFSRDESLPYNKEVDDLEKTYPNYHIGSMVPTFICPVISMLLMTVFLILFFVLKPNFNFLLYFCVLLIPAIISLVTAVLVMILRVNVINKIEKEKPKVDQEFRTKVHNIISKY